MWYAVLRDKNDNDWGTGSSDINEALKMADKIGPEAYIAAISEGPNPICLEIMRPYDFVTDCGGIDPITI